VIVTAEEILKSHGAYAGTFYDVGQHAPIAGIRDGLKAFKEAGADAIVSVGGGSPIDASKVILYHLQKENPGEPCKKQIAIPTTLSAAEYTVRFLGRLSAAKFF
jgi:alcohol dehydrogenase class IV